MTTTPIEGTNTDYGIFAASNATSQAGDASTAGSQDEFLQLMVAQLQYQDPMNPTDTSTMLTQNATFTEVQAIQEMSDEMQMLLSSQISFGAAAMVGKQVSYYDAAGNAQTGTATGVSFTGSGPELTLADGTTLALNSVAGVTDGSTTPTSTATS